MQHQKPSPPTGVFCVAALADATWLAQWEKHLLPLQQAGHLTVWSEGHLHAGASRTEQIEAHLQQAELICLLLSADFFASEECHALMQRALQRQQEGAAHILPLLLRPVTWQESPLVALACLPSNEVPVTSWDDPEQAFQNCAQGVLRTLGRSTSASSQPQSTRAMTTQQRNREAMLRRLRRSYEDLMQQSLQGASWLELGFTEKPAAVQNPVTLLWRNSNQSGQPLPPGTTILQAYDRATHELLILGEPGTGKSTLLLDLARQLVQRAEHDETHPLPVILPLSSWAVKRPSLQDWIADQLSQIYDIPRRLGEQWVREEAILPLLDGLDEMDEAARPACIAAINGYHQAHLLVPLVICSRKTDYETASMQQRLILQRAVVVQSLSREQVDAYLVQAGKPLAALRSTFKKNTPLQELATTPLMLSILMLTYQGTAVRELSRKEPLLQQQIWTDYVEHMVERKGNAARYPLQRTCAWLSWLARQMRERNQTVFYLEHLQPDWLMANKWRSYEWLAVRLPAILVSIIISFLVQLFLTPLTPNFLSYGRDILQYCTLGGFLGGLWSAPLFPGNDLASRKRTSLPMWGKRLIVSAFIGLLMGLSLGFVLSPTYTLSDWVHDGVPFSLMTGLGSLLLQYFFVVASHHTWSTSNNPTLRWPHLARFSYMMHAWRALQVATIVGLSYGLSIEPRGSTMYLAIYYGIGLRFGLSFGFVSILVGLAIEAQTGGIYLTEHLQWTWGSLKRSLFSSNNLRRTVFLTCLITLIAGEREVSLLGLYGAIGHGLSYGLSYGLSFWLVFGLFQGIAQEQIENRDRRVANQGIRRSLHNGVVMGIITTLITELIGSLSAGLNYALSVGLGFWPTISSFFLRYLVRYLVPSFMLRYALGNGLLVGVGAGCFALLLTGGLAFLRHYVIRFLLWRSQTFSWRAVSFLDDATARVLLRRIGGGYSFTHRLLLDHFADLDADVPSASTTVSPE